MCRGIPASQAPAFRIMMMAMMIIAIIAIIITIIITHRCIVSAIHAIIQVFIVHVKAPSMSVSFFSFIPYFIRSWRVAGGEPPRRPQSGGGDDHRCARPIVITTKACDGARSAACQSPWRCRPAPPSSPAPVGSGRASLRRCYRMAHICRHRSHLPRA